MNILIILKSLGLYMIISGLTILIRRKTFFYVVKDLFLHKSTMWVAGFFLMFLGGVIALEKTVSSFINLLGSVILIKGAIYIFAPEIFTRLLNRKIIH